MLMKMISTIAKAILDCDRPTLSLPLNPSRPFLFVSCIYKISVLPTYFFTVTELFVRVCGSGGAHTHTMYEPEQFPGLIYRMDDPKVVILIFTSGKLVCTGAKKETEVHRAVSKLQNTLEEKTLITYESAATE